MQPYAVVVPTRDAAVAALNAPGVLPAGCVAAAIYDEAVGLQQLAAPRVVVKPATRDQVLLSRGGPEGYVVALHVAVQFKWPSGTGLPVADADPFLTLAERIAAARATGGLFLGDPAGLGGDRSTICTAARFPKGLFIEEHLTAYRVFTSVVELTFKVSR